MKSFFLNSTRIVEANPKVYWSIIAGVVACLVLFIAEIVHIQQIVDALNTRDQGVLGAAIEPVAQLYHWARIAIIIIIIIMLIWSSVEYTKTKNKLGLK